MSVNSKMTAIADKIRALLGVDGAMGLDAMAAHLDTEKANVTAALAAIAEKGVTVDSGSNSDDLATLIAAIEAGANGAWGLFTPASTSLVTIEHGLGKRPVVWGLKATKLDGNAPKNSMGHRTFVRGGVATGQYTNTITSFSQLAENNSCYGKHGTSTKGYLDTESSAEITESSFYQGYMYINKNFFKVLPSSSYAQDSITVGETYIWFVLGAD